MKRTDTRQPRWIYDQGTEPDYRFSLANERTFLAWIRTALGLVVAGVAVHAVGGASNTTLTNLGAAALVTLGMVCAPAAWLRWARAERAIRKQVPLPALGATGILVTSVILGVALVLVPAVR
ncbi:YidH family protein [Rhodococcus jostii]|uniref:YidH family protein n=1 Tax=Rhodococcus jostii TaxID=132919 RepID=UPI00363A1C25